jgi:hypothetical protein
VDEHFGEFARGKNKLGDEINSIISVTTKLLRWLLV